MERSAQAQPRLYKVRQKEGYFSAPFSSANPYLCFSALPMAGLDGIQKQIDPGDAVEKDLYDLEGEDAAALKSTPTSLGEVLDALEADHDVLLHGGVFTPDLIETWISYKRERELAPVTLRPVPYGFFLSYDA